MLIFLAPQMRCLFEGSAYCEDGACLKIGKRKREVVVVVLAKLTALTTELHIARILDRELNGQVVKYYHFELKIIAFDEKKFLMLVPNANAPIRGRHLSRDSAYSSK